MSYSSTIGRWLERDPEDYIDGENLYQFVGSNPVNYVDPWGLQAAPAGPATAPAYPPVVGPQIPSTSPAYKKYPLIPGGPYGSFSGSLGRNDDYSSAAIINFFPDNKCNCSEIVFVQYYREVTGIDANSMQIKVPAWTMDTGDPHPFPSNPSGHWTPTGPSSSAKLTDEPGASGPKTAWWFGNYLQVFVTTAYCAKGKDAGKSYGSIVWGHYWDYNKGTVTRFIEGQVSAGSTTASTPKFGGSKVSHPGVGGPTTHPSM